MPSTNALTRLVMGRILKRREYFRPVMISHSKRIYHPWVEVEKGGFFSWRGGKYKIVPDRLCYLGREFSAIYSEGHPMPIDDSILHRELPEIMDADGQPQRMDSEQLQYALEAEAVKTLVAPQRKISLVAGLIINFAVLIICIVIAYRVFSIGS